MAFVDGCKAGCFATHLALFIRSLSILKLNNSPASRSAPPDCHCRTIRIHADLRDKQRCGEDAASAQSQPDPQLEPIASERF